MIISYATDTASEATLESDNDIVSGTLNKSFTMKAKDAAMSTQPRLVQIANLESSKMKQNAGMEMLKQNSSLMKGTSSSGTLVLPSPKKVEEQQTAANTAGLIQGNIRKSSISSENQKADLADEFESWVSKDLASSSSAPSSKSKALRALRSRMFAKKAEKAEKAISREAEEKSEALKTRHEAISERSADAREIANQKAAAENAAKLNEQVREAAKREEKYEESRRGDEERSSERDYAAGFSRKDNGRQSSLSFSQQQKNNNEAYQQNRQQTLASEGEAKAQMLQNKSEQTAPKPQTNAQNQAQAQGQPQTNQQAANLQKGGAAQSNSQYSGILRDETLHQSQNSSFVKAKQEIVAAFHAPTSMESTLKKSNKEIWSGDEVAAKLLFMLMKSSNEQAYEHSERVIDLSSELAMTMGIKDPKFLMELKQGAAFCDIGEIQLDLESASPQLKKELSDFLKEDEIKNSGFLHDIGKIFIPKEIINKKGKLTEEEFQIVKQHPINGEKILRGIPGLAHTIPSVRHHHERWDGKGYPDALGGEEIPYQARIITVCDSFDAMVSDRPHRAGMTLDEAVAELKRCSGTQFDPLITKAFIEMVQKKYGVER